MQHGPLTTGALCWSPTAQVEQRTQAMQPVLLLNPALGAPRCITHCPGKAMDPSNATWDLPDPQDPGLLGPALTADIGQRTQAIQPRPGLNLPTGLPGMTPTARPGDPGPT